MSEQALEKTEPLPTRNKLKLALLAVRTYQLTTFVDLHGTVDDARQKLLAFLSAGGVSR